MGDRSGIYRKKKVCLAFRVTLRGSTRQNERGKQGHWCCLCYGARTEAPALGPGALEHPLGALWPLDGGEGLWGKCFKGAARDLLQPRWILKGALQLPQGHQEAPSTHHQSWALLWPRHGGAGLGG